MGDVDAAGLVIASGGQPVLIGYWRSGRTIVKLRVLGPDAYEAFAVLAEVVVLGLSAASDPGGMPTATFDRSSTTRSIPTSAGSRRRWHR